MSKKDFILQHPKLKASEVAGIAAASGMKISPNYINVVRSNDRTQRARGDARKNKQKKGDTIGMPATKTDAEMVLEFAGLRLMEALNEHSRAIVRVALESVVKNLAVRSST